MPLSLPVLDDRTFEQLLDEAKRRIPVHTPEWTNFQVESDPGVTIVQLFASLVDSLLYRANRIPERNRLKFLQLLGIPLRPPAAAEGLVTIRNDRAPIEPLVLDRDAVVTAGNVSFLTRDGVTVLPVEAQVYYKRKISRDDPAYDTFKTKYEAVLAARESSEGAAEAPAPPPVTSPPLAAETPAAGGFELAFYETTLMPAPTPSIPAPVVDIANAAIDRAVYVALLAPANVDAAVVREALAHATLSLGVVPALGDQVPPLPARRRGVRVDRAARLVYELPDTREPGEARWGRPRMLEEPDVLSDVGIVKLELPDATRLDTWTFSEPITEGTGDFPPRIEDDEVRGRVVTWLRVRLDTSGATATSAARVTWIGINAARVRQAIPVVREDLGRGTGEPDQTVTLANRPVLESGAVLEIQGDTAETWRQWRRTDDLLTADITDEVFALDPESGQIRFGRVRPGRDRAIRASYEYGGGRQGNVPIGAIKTSPHPRLGGGFKLENPLPTWGGDEGESVAEGERNIPLYLRHRDRLVTERDFQQIARRTPGVDVGRVDVLPLVHPSTPATSAPGVVTVMVVPRYDPVRPFWPSPDRLFLRAVCAHLDPRRLLTTEVHVRGPAYVPVHVSVGVQVMAGHVRDVVLRGVRRRLDEYLAALPPGGPEAQGWPLGKRLLRKDLEAVVTRVSGVEFVTGLEMAAASAERVEEYELRGLELPLLVKSSVREGDVEPVSAIVGTAPTAQPPRIVPVPVSRAKC